MRDSEEKKMSTGQQSLRQSFCRGKMSSMKAAQTIEQDEELKTLKICYIYSVFFSLAC